jgi:hypothetical protein
MARFRGNFWGIPLHTHDGNPTTRVTIQTAPTSPSDIVHDIRKYSSTKHNIDDYTVASELFATAATH